MGAFTVGEVVLIPFPYADFSRFKKRPALIVGTAEFDNFILCQITSKAETSKKAILLSGIDFQKGGLNLDSYIRPDKLFTIDRSIIQKSMGVLRGKKLEVVKSKIRHIFD